jgi:hypothetical protein
MVVRNPRFCRTDLRFNRRRYRRGIAIPLVRRDNAAAQRLPRRRSAAFSRSGDFYAHLELRFVAVDQFGSGARSGDQGVYCDQ